MVFAVAAAAAARGLLAIRALFLEVAVRVAAAVAGPDVLRESVQRPLGMGMGMGLGLGLGLRGEAEAVLMSRAAVVSVPPTLAPPLSAGKDLVVLPLAKVVVPTAETAVVVAA